MVVLHLEMKILAAATEALGTFDRLMTSCPLQIRPVIEKVYPFTELASAFEKVGTKHNHGKSVLDVSGEYIELKQDEHQKEEEQEAKASI